MKNYLASLLIFIILLGLLLSSTEKISSKAEEEGLYIIGAAIKRSTVQCYAIEGKYPKSLTYLKDNYGLRIDDNKYFVHYSYLGSNILPDVTVMRKDYVDE